MPFAQANATLTAELLQKFIASPDKPKSDNQRKFRLDKLQGLKDQVKNNTLTPRILFREGAPERFGDGRTKDISKYRDVNTQHMIEIKVVNEDESGTYMCHVRYSLCKSPIQTHSNPSAKDDPYDTFSFTPDMSFETFKDNIIGKETQRVPFAVLLFYAPKIVYEESYVFRDPTVHTAPLVNNIEQETFTFGHNMDFNDQKNFYTRICSVSPPPTTSFVGGKVRRRVLVALT